MEFQHFTLPFNIIPFILVLMPRIALLTSLLLTMDTVAYSSVYLVDLLF